MLIPSGGVSRPSSSWGLYGFCLGKGSLQFLEATEDEEGIVGVYDIRGEGELVAAGEDDVEVGIVLAEGVDVAFYLETGAVEGGGEHAVLGGARHEGSGGGGVAAVVDGGEGCRVVVHGAEAETDARADDTAGEVAIDDEVIGDACAGIDDEEGVLAVVGADVGCETVRSVAFGDILDGAGRVVAEPEGGEAESIESALEVDAVFADAGDDDAVNRCEVAVQALQGIRPGFCDALEMHHFLALSHCHLAARIAYVDEEFHVK